MGGSEKMGCFCVRGVAGSMSSCDTGMCAPLLSREGSCLMPVPPGRREHTQVLRGRARVFAEPPTNWAQPVSGGCRHTVPRL